MKQTAPLSEKQRYFKQWRYMTVNSSKKGVPSKVASIMKRTLLQSYRKTLLGAFRNWIALSKGP